jgi:hypothetical protein
MLRALADTGLPLYHVVAAPGSDGDCSYGAVQAALREQDEAGRYRGCFSLAPVLDVLRRLSATLEARRTPRIILAAADGALPETGGLVTVPRGSKPRFPASWLTHAFVFAGPDLP